MVLSVGLDVFDVLKAGRNINMMQEKPLSEPRLFAHYCNSETWTSRILHFLCCPFITRHMAAGSLSPKTTLEGEDI